MSNTLEIPREVKIISSFDAKRLDNCRDIEGLLRTFSPIIIITKLHFSLKFASKGGAQSSDYLPHNFHWATTLSRSNPTPECQPYGYVCTWKKEKKPTRRNFSFHLFHTFTQMRFTPGPSITSYQSLLQRCDSISVEISSRLRSSSHVLVWYQDFWGSHDTVNDSEYGVMRGAVGIDMFFSLAFTNRQKT